MHKKFYNLEDCYDHNNLNFSKKTLLLHMNRQSAVQNEIPNLLQPIPTLARDTATCKVCTDVGGINSSDCPPVREVIHSLKLADYLPVQTHKPYIQCFILMRRPGLIYLMTNTSD